MSVILSNRNLLNTDLQKNIFKYWEYETGISDNATTNPKPFKKYILCLFNEKNKEINYNLEKIGDINHLNPPFTTPRTS